MRATGEEVLAMAQLKFNRYIWEEIANFTDARTIKWALISSPTPVISIILIYIYIVYFGGPRFMENRQPYLLKRFMQSYNIFQIITNFWLLFNVMTSGRPFTAVWRYCDSIDEICGPNTEKQLEIMWWALVLRIIDFSETIVFVLRRKNQQISLLHVYHHISTVLYLWLHVRHLVHGYTMILMAINSSVHMIMYSYYFLSTYGSNMQRILLSFKKWITIIQIIQIIFLMTACLQGLTSYCNDNKIARYSAYITFFNGVGNLSLFLNFYKNSYKKSKTA